MRAKRNLAVVMVASVGVLGLAACDSDDGESTVAVVLSEWIVDPDVTEVDAGDVTFEADNQGGEVHELVIVKADDPSDLPTDDDGAVDEAGLAEGAFIGEIEEFASQSQESATFDLDAGTYVLFCNIVEVEEDGEVESHFQEGMVNTIEVT